MNACARAFPPGTSLDGHSPAMPTEIPLMDLVENANERVLYCDLPGASRSGIELIIHNGELRLRAAAFIGSPPGKIHTLEVCDVAYVATIRLTAPVDAARVTAVFSLGVLKVSLPFPEKTGPVRIPIIHAKTTPDPKIIP